MNNLQYFPGIRKPSTDFGAVRNQLQSRPFYLDVDLSTARSLAAGTQLVLPISGNFFYIDQRPSSGVAYVHFEDIAPGSTPVGIYPGAAFAVPFTQISIENVAQAGLSIRIIYGTDVNFIPSNAAGVSVLNSISVVDGGQAITDAGKSFIAFGNVGAGLGVFSHVQLFNPAAATKNVYLKKITATVGAPGAPTIELRSINSALATLIGNAANKNLSGSASVAEIRQTQNAVQQGTRIGSYTVESTIYKGINVTFEKPIKLPAGYGIIIAPNNTNIDIYGSTWDFDEGT